MYLQGSYNCHTDDIPTSVCSNSRYLTILFKKKELSHDGYDFSMELREMTQSKKFIITKSIYSVIGQRFILPKLLQT